MTDLTRTGTELEQLVMCPACGQRMSERPGQYVRDHYGVPAFIGRPIVFTWNKPRPGKITGFDGAQLVVKFDDEPRGSGTRLHPTWEVQYPLGFEGEPVDTGADQ